MTDWSAMAEFYRAHGYAVLRGIVPPALVTDLRRVAEEGRAIARRLEGPSAQRLQPLGEHIDLAPFRAVSELPELDAAIVGVLTPRHRASDTAPR
jgi:hypothetical protein